MNVGKVVKFTDIPYAQSLYKFSHYNAARLFIEGKSILKTDPARAEKAFRAVTEIEPSNPYGWMYLLFIQEDSNASYAARLRTCERLVSAAEQKKIGGLDGLGRGMLVRYLQAMGK